MQALVDGEETMNKLQSIEVLVNENFGRRLPERMKQEGTVHGDLLPLANKNLKRKHLTTSMTSSILHKTMMHPEMIQKAQIIKQMSV